MPSPEFQGYPFILPTVAPTVLVALVLPDQTYYQFGYNTFLELSQITLPTGGTVTYTYADIPFTGDDAYQDRVLASRTTIDGVNAPATTNYTWLQSRAQPNGAVGDVNIQTDPLGNDEVHFINAQTDGTNYGGSLNDTQTDSYQGCSPYQGKSCVGTGQLLKSVARVYQQLSQATGTMLQAAGGPATTQCRIESETTTLPSSTGTTLVSQKVYTYVPPQVTFGYWSVYAGSTGQTCWQCGEFNQIRSVAEYDYGNGAPGGLWKTTTTYYKWEDPTPSGSSTVGAQYLASSLIDLPWYVREVGAVNFGETDYYYDETAPVASSITTQAGGYLLGPVRGHLTSLARSLNGGTQGRLPKNPGDPTTTTVWYNTGVPYQTVDPNGNPPTTYSYDPAYAGAYVTKTVDPIGNSVKATYDYNTGVVTSFTDVNSATTTYTYDALRRPLNVLYPDGGQHDITYNVTLPPGQGNVVVQDLMDTRFDEHTIVYDGFGREIETQHNTDSLSTTYVDTKYDQNGHPWWVTNPYRSTPAPTDGVTKTYYDALGREISSVLSDGSMTSTSYSGMPYAHGDLFGLSKTYTDPDGNRTVWASDALGRLGTTVENSIGAQNLPALTTMYLYDTLNNLTNVQQQGDGTNSSAFRNRSFGYDHLSRLVYSMNPETGAISYFYDLNSNLIKKTDARNTSTIYNYDALNRLTSKTYTSDAAHTPYSCYQYGTDQYGTYGYTLERLTMEWTEPPSATPCVAPSNALTSRAFSAYDSRGRVLNEQQCYATSCGSNGYGYDLAGHLLDFGNLIGTGAFTNAYDSGGKLSSVSESWSENVGPEFPGTLFSGATYAPHGALTGATYGTNLSISRTYDSRLRILGETDLGTTVQQPATGGSVNLTITGGVQTK
jgi:YD repeat-containing protein